jgi:hypothetical protein
VSRQLHSPAALEAGKRTSDTYCVSGWWASEPVCSLHSRQRSRENFFPYNKRVCIYSCRCTLQLSCFLNRRREDNIAMRMIGNIARIYCTFILFENINIIWYCRFQSLLRSLPHFKQILCIFVLRDFPAW